MGHAWIALGKAFLVIFVCFAIGLGTWSTSHQPTLPPSSLSLSFFSPHTPRSIPLAVLLCALCVAALGPVIYLWPHNKSVHKTLPAQRSGLETKAHTAQPRVRKKQRKRGWEKGGIGGGGNNVCVCVFWLSAGYVVSFNVLPLPSF